VTAKKAGTHCRNCICIGKCANRGSTLASCDEEEVCLRKGVTPELVTPGYLTRRKEEETVRRAQAPSGILHHPTCLVFLRRTTKEEEEEEAPHNMPIGDLPSDVVTDADQKLLELYGEYIHQNDGSHLDGHIQDYAVWQARWQKLIVLPCQCYDAPSRAVG
jgi:hypothetical protein